MVIDGREWKCRYVAELGSRLLFDIGDRRLSCININL